jgi:hypothetical protein
VEKSTNGRPRKASRVVLVIEAARGLERGDPSWTITVSMPGREGAFSKSWGKFPEVPSAPTYSDMIAFVDRIFADYVDSTGGVQEVLPLA